MSELIAHLPYRIVASGDEFYVSVAGEPRPDGRWEGWLEYVPLNDTEPIVTPTETTQSTRDALLHWAETLTEVYAQGAFDRGIRATADLTARRLVARPIPTRLDAPAPSEVPNPFELFAAGRATMRARLTALSRRLLLAMIAAFDLNPAGRTLVWLSDHQLVTFIVTAVEVQILSGRRLD